MFDLLPQLREGASSHRALTLSNLKEDLQHVRAGVMDLKSFVSGYVPRVQNRVEVVTRDKHGKIKTISRNHNLRTTMGRDNWQRLLMFGDIAANCNYTGNFGTATGTSATSLTNSGAAFPTSGGVNGSLQGHIVVAIVNGTTAAWGVITSNTGTALTIDKWHTPGSSTDATASTPTTPFYMVLPHAGPGVWIGLSTSSAAAAAGDVLRTADGLYGDGTTTGTATEQTANGLARVFVQPTFPSAGNIQFQYTFTYTGSSLVTLPKAVLCNSTAVAGSLLILETLLNNSATPSANGDTVQITWTISL